MKKSLQIRYLDSKSVENQSRHDRLSILSNLCERHIQVLNSLVEFAEKLREGFTKVRDLFMEVTAAIDRSVSWLGSMVNVCNDKMGKPAKKCEKAFDEAKKKCVSFYHNCHIFGKRFVHAL